MEKFHVTKDGIRTKCWSEFGRCRICELTDPSHRDYNPLYRALYSLENSTEDPTLLQKAVNLGRAVTHHLAAGLPESDDETVNHRLAICHSCERFDVERVSCRACGCRMNVKVRWAEQKCPIGKW